MNKPLALVVGAGPTGMTMAIELKRAGVDVRIIDKSSHQALHSQALIIQARTLEQFQRYGIATKAISHGRKVHGVRIWSDGKQILSVAFDRILSRYPYQLFLPQNKTEAILNELMESFGVRAERETELISITQQNGWTSSIVRHADGRQEEVEARWVIGCDGAHSEVRKLLNIPFEGKGVSLSFFLGDVELDGPGTPTEELFLHLHSGDVVFMARLTDKLTRVIVALHSSQGDQTDQELSVQDFQAALDRARVRAQIHSAEWMTPFHVNDLQAKQYRAGSAFLAGDASHIHSPVGGQGMNTGIQDVANLAWKLAAVARGADEAILDSYEQERGEVGKALLRFTERGLKMATARNPLVEGIRDALLPLIASFNVVQNTMLGFISETAIGYRSSSIVADHGGDGSLRAGDRLPDLSFSSQGQATSLLHDWTEAKHLVLLINATERERDVVAHSLTQATVMGLKEEDLDDEGRHTLGLETKVLVVRPDGYVGFRGPLSKREESLAYARQDALQ
jgi:2-polyprenyl-6-methoxyphenol hydroxylase-like FAD-dependent oxidoreductase